MSYGPTDAYAHEAITVAGTAIGLTAATYAVTDRSPVCRAVITVETAEVRYRYDGTAPTASVGHLAEIGDVLELEGEADIRNFQAIRTGSTSGHLEVTYERGE